jgi:type IV secretory pathway protease TraF
MRGLFCSHYSIRVVFYGVLIVVISGGAGFGMRSFGIRFNATPSVARGLYRISSDIAAPYVEFCPPAPFGALSIERGYRHHVWSGCDDGGEPLLKPVAALPDDVVQVSAAGISVNGVLIHNSAARIEDTLHRTIRSWPCWSESVQKEESLVN